MEASGISSGFPLLFRSPGQVPHVLRTRSPLDLPQCCHWLDPVRLACVKHAASVRPEPGSNSPSKNSTGTRPAEQSLKSPDRTEGTYPSSRTGRGPHRLAPVSAESLTCDLPGCPEDRPHWRSSSSLPLSRSSECSGGHVQCSGAPLCFGAARPEDRCCRVWPGGGAPRRRDNLAAGPCSVNLPDRFSAPGPCRPPTSAAPTSSA